MPCDDDSVSIFSLQDAPQSHWFMNFSWWIDSVLLIALEHRRDEILGTEAKFNQRSKIY